MKAGLAPIRDAKTILLTTYKRDGTAVATPVSLAFDGERAFFRSYDKAWKTKRLRHDPAVQAAPATLRGRPTGLAGVSPRPGGWTVAVQHLGLVGIPRGSGAVGVQDQRPAPPVARRAGMGR